MRSGIFLYEGLSIWPFMGFEPRYLSKNGIVSPKKSRRGTLTANNLRLKWDLASALMPCLCLSVCLSVSCLSVSLSLSLSLSLSHWHFRWKAVVAYMRLCPSVDLSVRHALLKKRQIPVDSSKYKEIQENVWHFATICRVSAWLSHKLATLQMHRYRHRHLHGYQQQLLRLQTIWVMQRERGRFQEMDERCLRKKLRHLCR